MMVAIAERFQGHRAEQIARLDPAPRAVGVLMFYQPIFRVSKRSRAQPFEVVMVVETQHFVDQVEHGAQRKGAFGAGLLEPGEMRRLDVQLEDSVLMTYGDHWPGRLQNHQRESRAASPRRE